MSFADIFKPSQRMRRWWRKLLEKMIDSYYEGPKAPNRLGYEVEVFTMLYPNASKAEWATFAQKMAENSYQSGFIRGREWDQRGWDGPPPDDERLAIAEAQAHDWSLADERPETERLLLGGVYQRDPFEGMSEEGRQQLTNVLQGAQRGMFPVEINMPDRNEREEADET